MLFSVLDVLLRNQWNSEVVSLLIKRALGKHVGLPRWIPVNLMRWLNWADRALLCVVPRINSWT